MSILMTKATARRFLLTPPSLYFLGVTFLLVTMSAVLPSLGFFQLSDAQQRFLDEDEDSPDIAFPGETSSASDDWQVQLAWQSKQARSLLLALDTLASPPLPLIAHYIQSFPLSGSQYRPVLYHRKLAPSSSDTGPSPT